jgi:hypothetical protein
MAHNIDLPRHRYVHVIEAAVLQGGAKDKTIPAVWWGMSATPGRMFGCHILLESGAMVVDLPLHCLRHRADATHLMRYYEAQQWDAYGWSLEAHEPAFLSGLDCRVLAEDHKSVRSTTSATAIRWSLPSTSTTGWSPCTTAASPVCRRICSW